MASLGKYTLVRKLASGGMAEVFLARTEGPAGFSKTQVVKRILPHLSDNEEFVSMFVNEARLAALLNHPNLIQIFELGRDGGSYFIAMELVDGTNLRSLARFAQTAGQYLPYEVVLKIVSQACEGLAYAHEFVDDTGRPLELVHRDISPDNVLISRQGAVKVADFGIAKAANLPQVTKAGVLKGKISYMPPEQLKEVPLDRRADVFALGVVLFEALTFVKPFASATEVTAMQSILNDEPSRLTDRRPDLPSELQDIVTKALVKDREQRYADCRAMQADIERFLLATGLAVSPSDIAKVVGRYLPAATRVSDPLLAVAPPEKAGTPPAGFAVTGQILDPSTVLEVHDTAVGPATQTGPKEIPQELSPREPSRPASVAELEPKQASLPPRPAAEAGPPTDPAGSTRRRRGLGIGVALGAVGALAVFALRPHDAPSVAPPTVIRAPARPPPPVPATPPPSPPPPIAAPLPPPVAVAPPASQTAPEPPHSVATPTESHRPPRHHVTPPAPASAAVAPGTLMLRVAPWANIDIDGKSYGPTPLPPIKLTPGKHQVHLANSELPAQRTVSVDITSGATATLRVNLELPP